MKPQTPITADDCRALEAELRRLVHPSAEIPVKIGGKEIKYTVTTGTIILKEDIHDKEKDAEVEKPRAQIFFIAYTKDGVTNKAKRPVTFSFNGGPGSSSVWLHMGVLGPRRVVLTDEGELPPPSPK